ncbi:MAG: DedA family protein [Actinomycetota bacterium]|nr:DedA family protein [Actinomycetota bacterium]
MIAAILQDLVRWVGPVFAVAGYPIVGGAVLMERSVFIGLIVPGDVILALGGIYAARGDLSLPWVIVIGILAAVTGESIGFWLGRRYGRRLVHRLPLVNRLEGRLDAAEEYFRKHGGKTVAIGRYATAAGAFVPFVAGLSRMRYRRFLAFDVPAIVVWAAGIVLLGYFLEGELDLVDRILSRFGWVMLGLLVGIVGGRFVYRRWRERKENRRASASK